MIAFTCPACNEPFEVPDSLLGQLEKCPACGGTCRIALPRPRAVQVVNWPELAARRARKAKIITLGLLAGFVVLIVVGLLLPDSEREVGGAFFVAGIVLLVIMLARAPGTIARDRRLANADGIAAMGVLGLFFPPLWLVALILALAGNPPAHDFRSAARRPCPQCGESIATAAKMCRFCGASLLIGMDKARPVQSERRALTQTLDGSKHAE